MSRLFIIISIIIIIIIIIFKRSSFRFTPYFQNIFIFRSL